MKNLKEELKGAYYIGRIPIKNNGYIELLSDGRAFVYEGKDLIVLSSGVVKALSERKL